MLDLNQRPPPKTGFRSNFFVFLKSRKIFRNEKLERLIGNPSSLQVTNSSSSYHSRSTPFTPSPLPNKKNTLPLPEKVIDDEFRHLVVSLPPTSPPLQIRNIITKGNQIRAGGVRNEWTETWSSACLPVN